MKLLIVLATVAAALVAASASPAAGKNPTPGGLVGPRCAVAATGVVFVCTKHARGLLLPLS